MLNELREKIDSIHEKIIELVEQRIEIAKQIAVIKKEERLPILDAQREEKIRLEVRKMAKSRGLSTSVIDEIIQLILEYSRLEMGAV